MAVLLFDDRMNEKLRSSVLKMTKPTKTWKVNDNITGYKFDLKDFEDNEVVVARFMVTVSPNIRFIKSNRWFITNKD